MTQNELTKESLSNLFPNNFQLTHYVIKIVQQEIEGGNHDPNITYILNEVRKQAPYKENCEQEKK